VTREAAIAGFLAAEGWEAAERRALAGDASARRYERLTTGLRRAVLMDAPPERGEDVRPFVAVTGWLRGLGLSAPEVLAADAANGLLLLEDLGDDLFARVCAREPGREAELYAAAVDVLAELAAAPVPWAVGGWTAPLFDRAMLASEAGLMADWYLQAVLGSVPEGMRAEYAGLVAAAIAALPPPRAAVLRDYHAENLVWLPDRAGSARVGLLDYQGMVIGHGAYDVVSLVEDARRDLAPGLAAVLLERLIAATDAERDDFLAAAHLLSAQRNLKILGLFVRLRVRDGKAGYLRLLPRVWRHLAADLGHPALAQLRAWVTRNVPPPEAAVLARIEAVAA
jgi:N-acetylmuramate 1-kinase